MIKGIGTDILRIRRIEPFFESEEKLRRLFTETELAYLRTKGNTMLSSAAGIFCAKEACAKAFGTGFSGDINWRTIEVLHDGTGRPYFNMLTPCADRLHLSITHDGDYAAAFCVREEP